MEPADFWALIATCSSDLDPQDKQRTAKALAALEPLLGALKPDAVVAFGNLLGERLAAAFTADVWGAAHIINRGCNDDEFEYFRAWLVLQGQEVFERAVRVPDSLAEYKFAGRCNAEELLHLPATVYNELTGELDYTDRVAPADGELVGELWSDDKDLVKLLPALAAKYKFTG
jgi:Protein of unknown function (DUF4240)